MVLNNKVSIFFIGSYVRTQINSGEKLKDSILKSNHPTLRLEAETDLYPRAKNISL